MVSVPVIWRMRRCPFCLSRIAANPLWPALVVIAAFAGYSAGLLNLLGGIEYWLPRWN